MCLLNRLSDQELPRCHANDPQADQSTLASCIVWPPLTFCADFVFLPNSETISILLAHSLLRLCFAAFAFSFPLLCLHSPEGPRKKTYCCQDPKPKVGRQPPPYINTNRTWEDSSLQRLWLTACLHATVTQTAVKHNATSIGQQVPA